MSFLTQPPSPFHSDVVVCVRTEDMAGLADALAAVSAARAATQVRLPIHVYIYMYTYTYTYIYSIYVYIHGITI